MRKRAGDARFLEKLRGARNDRLKMVSLVGKKQDGKTYYYLVESAREHLPRAESQGKQLRVPRSGPRTRRRRGPMGIPHMSKGGALPSIGGITRRYSVERYEARVESPQGSATAASDKGHLEVGDQIATPITSHQSRSSALSNFRRPQPTPCCGRSRPVPRSRLR